MPNNSSKPKGKMLKESEIRAIKAQYKIGTRVELDSMEDKFNPVPKGTRGTVALVDSIGNIHVDWDNGQGLALIYGEDRFHIIDGTYDNSLSHNLTD